MSDTPNPWPYYTTASQTTYTFDMTRPEPSHGSLCKLQKRLQDGRLWWLGNRISDFRFYMWKLVK